MKNQTFYSRFASHRKSKKTALYYKGKRFSYAEIYSKAERQALLLFNQGVNEKSTVTRISDYFPESIITLLALLKIGCSLSILSPLLPPQAFLSLSKERKENVIFLQDSLYKSYLPALKEKNVPLVLLSPKKDLSFFRRKAYVKENKESLALAHKDGFTDSYLSFRSRKKRKEVPLFQNEKKEVLLFHSLGDTRPGKSYAFSNEIRDTTSVSFLKEVTPASRKGYFLPLIPLESAAGTLSGILTPLSLGRSISLVTKDRVKSALTLLGRKKADTLLRLPYRYKERLRERTKAKEKRIKSVILTRDKPDFELVKEGKTYERKQAYLCNEAGGFLLGGDNKISDPSCLGNPLPPFQAVLLPLKGTSRVNRGEEGRLAFSLPKGFLGYKGKSLSSSTIFFDNRPFFIRDDILINKEGNYYFVKRRENIVRFHGYPVYLNLVENLSLSIPGVISAKVFFDHSINHIPYFHLYIENRDHSDEVLFKELRARFDDKRRYYSIPKRISVYPRFPRTYKGEIDTKALCQFL